MTLQSDPLDLLLVQPFPGAVIELRGARAFVRGHGLGVFECAAVGQIGGDFRRSERMAADRRRDPRRNGTPADHGLLGEHVAPAPPAGAKQHPRPVRPDPGRLDIGVQRLGGGVVAGHGVLLAALLVQAELPTGALRTDIGDAHCQRRADSGEGIGEHRDQRPVAQPGGHRVVEDWMPTT
jgi:hypothetical protein